MELSCRFGNCVLSYCKQVVQFYNYSDLEVVAQAIDLVFEEMVVKVMDLDSEVELVEHVKENIAVVKQGEVADIEDIFHLCAQG